MDSTASHFSNPAFGPLNPFKYEGGIVPPQLQPTSTTTTPEPAGPLQQEAAHVEATFHGVINNANTQPDVAITPLDKSRVNEEGMFKKPSLIDKIKAYAPAIITGVLAATCFALAFGLMSSGFGVPLSFIFLMAGAGLTAATGALAVKGHDKVKLAESQFEHQERMKENEGYEHEIQGLTVQKNGLQNAIDGGHATPEEKEELKEVEGKIANLKNRMDENNHHLAKLEKGIEKFEKAKEKGFTPRLDTSDPANEKKDLEEKTNGLENELKGLIAKKDELHSKGTPAGDQELINVGKRITNLEYRITNNKKRMEVLDEKIKAKQASQPSPESGTPEIDTPTPSPAAQPAATVQELRIKQSEVQKEIATLKNDLSRKTDEKKRFDGEKAAFGEKASPWLNNKVAEVGSEVEELNNNLKEKQALLEKLNKEILDMENKPAVEPETEPASPEQQQVGDAGQQPVGDIPHPTHTS